MFPPRGEQAFFERGGAHVGALRGGFGRGGWIYAGRKVVRACPAPAQILGVRRGGAYNFSYAGLAGRRGAAGRAAVWNAFKTLLSNLNAAVRLPVLHQTVSVGEIVLAAGVFWLIVELMLARNS